MLRKEGGRLGGGGAWEEREGQGAGAACPMTKVGPTQAFERTRFCKEGDFPTQGQ